MKKSFVFIFITLVCAITIESAEPLTTALHNLTQSLHTLQTMFPPKKISNYQEFETAVNNAYLANNPALLDQFEQTLAMRTAKYLITTIDSLKKDNKVPTFDYARDIGDYIPFMAYVTEQYHTQYPDTEQIVNCASLAAGELQNEWVLIVALRFAGYKKIRLIPIDIIYEKWKTSKPIKNLQTWCQNINIPVVLERVNTLDNGVILEAFNDTYKYIYAVQKKDLPKNNLLLMIQPGSNAQFFVFPTGMPEITKALGTTPEGSPSSLAIRVPPYERVEIYLPFAYAEYSIEGKDEPIKKALDTLIQTWKKERDLKQLTPYYLPYYQKQLTDYILKNNTFGAFIVYLGNDLDLLFYELLKYTVQNKDNFLAFETLNLYIRQIMTIPLHFNEYKQHYGIETLKK